MATRFILICLLSSVATSAQAFQATQGYTGLLAVPNAQVQGPYEIDAQINDFVHAETRNRITQAQNLIFTTGLLPRLEIGGRVFTAFGAPRRIQENDLSINAKVQLYSNRWLALGVGVADIEGEAIELNARYAALDISPLPSLRVTLGGANGQRLDGFFGGVEWRPLPWVHLLSEYDTEGVGYGMRLVAPAWRGVSAYGVVSNQPRGDKSTMLAAGLSFSLGKPNVKPIPKRSAPVERDHGSAGTLSPRQIISSDYGWNSIHAFQDICLDEGTLQPVQERRFTLPIREASVICAAPEDGILATSDAKWSSQKISDFNWLDNNTWEGAGLEIRVGPAVSNTLATELGVFDYSLATLSSARIQLPSGLGFYAVHAEPLAESDDFRDGGALAGARFRSRIDEVMVQWSAHPIPGLFVHGSAGRKFIDGDMADLRLGELVIHSPQGRHQISAAYGDISFRSERLDNPQQHYYRYGYRFFWFEQDMALSLTHGCYLLAGDCGQTTLIERNMGSITFFVFHQIAGRNDQVGGFGLQVPLSFKRHPRWGALSLAGSPEFTYSIQSAINPEDGRNTIRPNFMFEPRLRYDFRRTVLDRNRAMPGYLP